MARATREQWKQRVQRWVDSGLTATEYAAETGINANTLAHWKWRLGIEAAGRTVAMPRGSGFVEVVTPSVRDRSLPRLNVATDLDLSPGSFEVVLSGLTIRVPPSFDSATLVRLVTALEAR